MLCVRQPSARPIGGGCACGPDRAGQGGSVGFPEGCQIPSQVPGSGNSGSGVFGLDGVVRGVPACLANGLTGIFTDAKSVSASTIADKLNKMTAVAARKSVRMLMSATGVVTAIAFRAEACTRMPAKGLPGVLLAVGGRPWVRRGGRARAGPGCRVLSGAVVLSRRSGGMLLAA
jgi:hypothetical protein